jgi:hypothetical protein
LDDRLRTLWFTMLAFGHCRGEAFAIRWSLIDLDASTVRPAKQIRRGDGHIVEKDLDTELMNAESEARQVGAGDPSDIKPHRRFAEHGQHDLIDRLVVGGL